MADITSILLLICFIGCQSPNSDRKNIEKNDDVTNIKSEEMLKTVSDTSGFLKDCNNWEGGLFMGYLQGVESGKDSLGPFCYYECYDCKKTFEIIFVYKDFTQRQNVDHDSLFYYFKAGCNDKFKNFQCFAFVYPFKNPDKQKNVHDMNIDFPVSVKIYERITDDEWKFVRLDRVKNFKEFSKLQFNSVYKL